MGRVHFGGLRVVRLAVWGESDVGRARALRDRVCDLARQQGLPCEIFKDEPCHERTLTNHAVDLTRRHVSSGGGVEGVAAPRRCVFATMHTRRAVHSDGARESARESAPTERREARLAPLRLQSRGGIQLTRFF